MFLLGYPSLAIDVNAGGVQEWSHGMTKETIELCLKVFRAFKKRTKEVITDNLLYTYWFLYTPMKKYLLFAS